MKNNVKEIALIGLLSATITAAKFALSFIPNIEIVTLLFILYTTVFGLRPTLLASFIFSTTEIFIYGFSTWLVGYYIIWPALILLTYFLQKRIRSEYGFALLGGLFGFLFGFFFALVESCFYGIFYGISYWIKGIPFDIIHGVSNFIII
ncbi:MAG: hypothetical protein WBI32_09005, partial [Halanaerobiales bacterium]